MSEIFCDVLIVGAGPSGLASANYCMHEGVDFFVLDSGRDPKKRSHDIPYEVIHGVGGAGLYSDGKISYYPSGHKLYSLASPHLIKKAYNWFHKLTSDIIVDYPEYPMYVEDEAVYYKGKNGFYEKKYNSKYLSDDEMQEIVDRLYKPISSRVKVESEVVCIERNDNELYKVRVINKKEEEEQNYYSKNIIYCGGRFGPISLKKIYSRIPFHFERFEYGIRIEQKKEDFIGNNFSSIDPKIVFNSSKNGIEYRTFCSCLEGRNILGQFEEIKTYSGARSKSNKSSIGFNVRINDYEYYKKNIGEITNMLNGDVKSFSMTGEEFLYHKDSLVKTLNDLIKDGLKKLSSSFSLKNYYVYGPCLEGVGMYPKLEADLRIINKERFWVAGDSTGLFRGLLAALLSGYYVAQKVCKNNIDNINVLNKNVKIKYSSIECMPVIFTAQSKKSFYARDAVCEYVLKMNMLPINPFRVFDYFLGDRVERDIVRRGNNNLIKICDELWVFGPISDGVLFEVIYAMNINKPIKFFTISPIANDIRIIKNKNDITFEQEIHLTGQKRVDLMSEIDKALSQSHFISKQLGFDFSA